MRLESVVCFFFFLICSFHPHLNVDLYSMGYKDEKEKKKKENAGVVTPSCLGLILSVHLQYKASLSQLTPPPQEFLSYLSCFYSRQFVLLRWSFLH